MRLENRLLIQDTIDELAKLKNGSQIDIIINREIKDCLIECKERAKILNQQFENIPRKDLKKYAIRFK